MRLTISDDLADQYLQHLPPGTGNDLSPGRDKPAPQLDALLIRVLERARPLADPKAMVLTAEQTTELVDALLLPEGARETGRIVEAAKELADMKIGKFRLKLPAPVLRGLKDRAEREGKPMQDYVQAIVDKITEEVAQYA